MPPAWQFKEQSSADMAISMAAPGFLYGCSIANNGPMAFDVGAGIKGSEDANAVAGHVSPGSVLTKQLGTLWAVGSGSGGLDTGTVSDSPYHVFVIRRPDTGVVDALFSLSATAPVMPFGASATRRSGGSVLS